MDYQRQRRIADLLAQPQSGMPPASLGKTGESGAQSLASLMPPRQELRAYQPTWRDRIATALMGDSQSQPRRDLVGGLLGSHGLGQTGMGLLDFTPVGGILGVQENLQAGDHQMAAISMMPGAPAAKPAIRAFHGGAASGIQRFRVPERGERAVFATSSREQAGEYGPHLYEMEIGGKLPRVDYMTVAGGDPIYDPAVMKKILDDARAGGASGVEIRNVQNFERGPLSTTYAVFDPDLIKILGYEDLRR